MSQILRRFNRDKYGEVNSFVRNWLPVIPAKRKAIILRHPQELALSVYNRKPNETPARLSGVWELLDSYVSSGYQVFRFEDFTSSVEELIRIGRWAGIDDLVLPADIVARPLNATRWRLVTRYADIPADVKEEIDAGVSWFQSKYYY